MPVLFPPQANAHLKRALATVCLLPCLVLGLIWATTRSPWLQGARSPVEQSIGFDHRHHVVDASIDCLYCHYEAERSAEAGLPSADLCMGCHAQIWPNAASLADVRSAYDEGRPLVWNAVHDLPDFVYFNHAIHLHHGIGCVSCHGRVDRMARVYRVESMTMTWCLDCHRQPVAHVRPKSELTSMDWQPRSKHEQESLVEEFGLQAQVHCSACHR